MGDTHALCPQGPINALLRQRRIPNPTFLFLQKKPLCVHPSWCQIPLEEVGKVANEFESSMALRAPKFHTRFFSLQSPLSPPSNPLTTSPGSELWGQSQPISISNPCPQHVPTWGNAQTTGRFSRAITKRVSENHIERLCCLQSPIRHLIFNFRGHHPFFCIIFKASSSSRFMIRQPLSGPKNTVGQRTGLPAQNPCL